MISIIHICKGYSMWVPMLKKMFVFNFNFFSDKLSLNVFEGVLGFDVTTCT